MSNSSSYFCTPQKHTDNGYTWYECKCCPYGYHIDLDFVRYCEYVSQEVEKTGSIKRRKDRRRQRQSMEVLLGFQPPILSSPSASITTTTPTQQNCVVTTSKAIIADSRKQPPSIISHFAVQDAFDNAVCDFEKTLQHSNNKLVVNNLPDVTAVSTSSPSISVNNISNKATVVNMDFESSTNDQFGGLLSPLTLTNIRKQMALSLERTKQLEDQVKLIPDLKHKLSKLTDENNYLLSQLKSYQEVELNNLNSNYLAVQQQIDRNNSNRIRSQSFTDIDTLDSLTRKTLLKSPLRKDCGVMCSVLTRNVGVGHQNPNTKSVTTQINNTSDKSYYNDNKISYFINQNHTLINNYVASKTTQTLLSDAAKRTISSQTINNNPVVNDGSTQTIEKKKQCSNASILVVPSYSDFIVQKTVDSCNIGISNDRIDDVICDKCLVHRKSIGVETDSSTFMTSSSISLASLTLPRSKSFNLDGEKLNLPNKRTVTKACQYDIGGVTNKSCQYDITGVTKSSQYDIIGLTKSCQYDPIKTHSKSCQQDLKTSDKAIQSRIDLVNCTKVHAASQVDVKKSDASSNTAYIPSEASDGCLKCNQKDKDAKKDVVNNSPVLQSKIPRPQPTTPVEKRKFRRQDTYTKTYSSPDTSLEYSSLGNDLGAASDNETTLNLLTSSLSSTRIHNLQHDEEAIPHRSSDDMVYDQSIQAYRKKRIPTKEMLAALKVLNDFLQKHQHTSNPKCNSAINIIQQEWFKLSSLPTANPLDLDDYLDAFENVSTILLEYIVNMTDTSGNTAMHYAVSHGNFDVVSILLDSKVCDVNKPNKAGYTSVMLASLAEVRSQTHIKVVQRLFQLADVNLKAKQYGQTALMLAVSHGHLNMVKMLLEAGADINIQDEDGSTALMCAAEHGHLEIVKLFLNHPDCDSTITDVDGSTALKIVMEAGHRHIGVLLYAHQRNLQAVHGSTKPKKTKSTNSIKNE